MRQMCISLAMASLVLLYPPIANAAETGGGKTKLARGAQGIEFFEAKIRPILVERCYECHSATSKEVKGGLLVDSRAALLAGGDSGHAVVPGSVDDSQLIAALRHETYEMPPDGQLPEEVIADFERWIEMGAPDPRDGPAAKAGGLPPPATKDELWSLQPIRVTAPGPTTENDWAWGEIDRHVANQRESQKLTHVGDADPLTLLRRVSFDLVGLPPTLDDMATFASDPSREAFEAIVDRLIASPQFGERWGRHWLDVARFAESNGRDRDVLFPHAWRYRNYVIDAFNADMPYDQFLREQVAGDLLPAANAAERDRLLIATGFLAIGPKSLQSRTAQREMDMIDDQIDTLGRAMLGLTTGCARCHDHKFDPIPTRDYYSLASIFRSTNTLYGGDTRNAGPGKGSEKLLQSLGEQGEARVAALARLEEALAPLKAQLVLANKKLAALKKQHDKLREEGKTPTSEQVAELALAERDSKTFAALVDIEKAKTDIAATIDYCMAVREAAKPVDANVLVRGELGKEGEAAPRGFLSAVTTSEDHAVPADASGRLQLANWLADRANPLVARVVVNRVWQHLFGVGIVRTTDNFGSNGERPTHPALLDYLAKRFIDEGWSTKRLVREIVLSHSYRLAGDYDAASFEVDPDNRYVWRQASRRLDVESIRDAMLSASGQLDLSRPSRSPVAEIGPGEVGRGINETPLNAPNHHRSVYLPILRTQLLEIFRVFDFAEPSIVVGTRDVTTVPAQALYMMNSPFVVEQADALAARLLEDAGATLAERVNLAYRLCFGRDAAVNERTRSAEFIRGVEARVASDEERPSAAERMAWTTFCQALLASAEFRYLQ